MDDIRIILGKNIRDLRVKSGWTQEKLAEKAELALKHYGRIERGTCIPTLLTFFKLVEILEIMRKYSIEPKRIQFCYPKDSRNSNMVLIEGIKNGNEGLKILKPIIVHDADGNYNEEIVKMFGE